MLKWKEANRAYIANAEDGYVGEWCVLRVYHDGGVPKGQEESIALTCSLPGIKDRIGHYLTVEEAKSKAEKVFVYWLGRAGLGEED